MKLMKTAQNGAKMPMHQWFSVAWIWPECRESGISAFRTEDGLWNQVDVEKYATPQGFRNDPKAVRKWYWERRMALPHAKPSTQVTLLWQKLHGGTPRKTSTIFWNVPDATTSCICTEHCFRKDATTIVVMKWMLTVAVGPPGMVS